MEHWAEWEFVKSAPMWKFAAAKSIKVGNLFGLKLFIIYQSKTPKRAKKKLEPSPKKRMNKFQTQKAPTAKCPKPSINNSKKIPTYPWNIPQTLAGTCLSFGNPFIFAFLGYHHGCSHFAFPAFPAQAVSCEAPGVPSLVEFHGSSRVCETMNGDWQRLPRCFFVQFGI